VTGPSPAALSAEVVRRGEAFWERAVVGWHAVYVGLLALVAFVVATDDSLTSGERAIGIGLVGVMTASYGLVGWRLLGEDQTGAAVVHLALPWGCFSGLALIAGGGVYFLLFALFPQTWAYLSTRFAVPATVVLVSGLLLIEVGTRGWTGDAWSDAAPWALLQIGLCLLLGLFVTGVFREAERRAYLIAELERTRAELASAEHARGALAERERLAHEIHDTLAQGFTSILTLAQATEAALDLDADAARERLALIERTARENLAEARALVGELGPVDLQGASLADAVSRVVSRFGEDTGLPAEVTVDGQPRPLSANSEVVLLRATQEALSNVRKHAAANSVRVRLTFPPDGPGSAEVEVVDDGLGFDPTQASGFGLRGMRSRVEQVGGTLEIASGPGLGTRVTVSLP